MILKNLNQNVKKINPKDILIHQNLNILNLNLLPIPVPKFIRDSLNVKDIKSSSPNKSGFDKKFFKKPIEKEKKYYALQKKSLI